MGSDDKKIDISTDDANINGSAEALQQYLLKQVETNKPVLRLRIDGSETSNATGYAYLPCIDRHSTHIHQRITTEQQNFLFLIDIPLPSSVAPHPIHYSLADSEPAYRGRSTREWTNPNGTGKREYTGLSADNTYIKQRDARRARGYPPWLVDLPSSAPASTAFNASLPLATGASPEEINEYVNQQTAIERTAWKSSQSLAQWAEEYVAATRSKEFIFLQETYGWDLEKLRSLIKEAVREQGQYSSAGSVEISTSHLNGRIQVRPASTMGKLVSAFG